MSEVDRAVKALERRRLLRSVVPLIAAGVGATWLYAVLAWTGPDELWIGPPLTALGTACAAIGLRRRLREIGSPAESTGRHYPWLLTGWALVVAGLVVPPYALS